MTFKQKIIFPSCEKWSEFKDMAAAQFIFEAPRTWHSEHMTGKNSINTYWMNKYSTCKVVWSNIITRRQGCINVLGISWDHVFNHVTKLWWWNTQEIRQTSMAWMCTCPWKMNICFFLKTNRFVKSRDCSVVKITCGTTLLPAPSRGSSQLLIASAFGVPMPSSSLYKILHKCGTHWCTDIHISKMKTNLKKVSLILIARNNIGSYRLVVPNFPNASTLW